MSKKSIVGIFIAVLLVISSVVSVSALNNAETFKEESGEITPMAPPRLLYWYAHIPFDLHTDIGGGGATIYLYADASTWAYWRMYYGSFYEDYNRSNEGYAYLQVDFYQDGDCVFSIEDTAYGDEDGYSYAYEYLYPYNGLDYNITGHSSCPPDEYIFPE